jgi:hypothetical protein
VFQDFLTRIDELGGPDASIDECSTLPSGPRLRGRADNYGWGEYADRDRPTPPPGTPHLPSGQRPVVLAWD